MSFLITLLSQLLNINQILAEETTKYTQPTLITQFILPYGLSLIPILSFTGSSLGFIELIPAVCIASEIKKDITTFVICMAFASFPMFFAFLIFILFGTKLTDFQYATPELAFKISSLGLICGVGLGMGGYALCLINKSLIVAKMKQKDFNLQFFLSNIFVELIGILTFVLVIVPLINMPAPSSIKWQDATKLVSDRKSA
ncbi:hypothetical protein CDIK_2376 [Cucumispora dikerogammari]|nr:hypothetical protein CDIK_2376 [Cucumispora dikerogammari]